MPELDDAIVTIGVPGINGTGITAPEKTAITNDLTALKAATYITQTPDATLSAEQALSSLATGLVKVTTGTGALSTAVAADLPTHPHTIAFSIPFVLDGGGSAITTGIKVPSGILLPFACTVTGWVLDASTASNLVITVQRASNATPSTFADISGTEKPTLVTQISNNDLALTTWTTAIAANDRLRVSVDSATSVFATLNLICTRTI